MMNGNLLRIILSAAVVGACAGALPSAMGQTRPNAALRGPGHSESMLARELLRLRQTDLIKAAAEDSKGKAVEPLWKAEAIFATWDDIAKDRVDIPHATQDYVESVKKYVDAQGSNVDGTWAIDQAKFIFARLSEPIINRMEYFSNGEKDRAALTPMAQLADRMLKVSSEALQAEMSYLSSNAGRSRYTSEDAYNDAFIHATDNLTEVEYYGAWAKYFLAMSMEPGNPNRAKLLNDAATVLNKWADDAEDNGVNSQALLLRGKSESEAGKVDQAVADLSKAQTYRAAPAWVQYQARYQTVVARLNARDFKAARADFENFKNSIPKDNKEALLSAEILDYRLAWAEADTVAEKERPEKKIAALKILGGIIEREPKFRFMIYDQLASQIPDNTDINTLMPLQQLAIANSKSMGQKGDTPKSRESLQAAVKAAASVIENKNATAAEKLEATYLAGVCSSVLNDLMAAVKYNVAFARTAPSTDTRAKEMLQLALEQIGKLRLIAVGQGISPELKELQDEALAMATGAYKDPRWYYTRGRTLEDSGKAENLVEAAKLYEMIPVTDKNYLDARYHLILVSMLRLKQINAGGDEHAIKDAAADLFKACTKFVQLLDDPPQGVSPEALTRARAYRVDIWLVEIDAALNPAVKRSDVAIDRLTKLDAMRDKLPAETRGSLLKYKVQAYQQANKPELAVKAIKDDSRATGADSVRIIANFVYTLVQEIDDVEARDPAEAKHKASLAVDLLAELIKSSEADPALKTEQGLKDIYGFKQLQSDLMVRAHRTKEAIELAKKLQDGRPQDIFNFMTEARADFAVAEDSGTAADYNVAQDYFSRILVKLNVGSESYWECYLRIIQCIEKTGGPTAAASIKKTLGDLKAVHGTKVGGTKYKEAFDKLIIKYGVV